MDGPFAETKEVIGGFAILNAGSRADAIELARQFMQLHADILGAAFEAECESVKCSMRRRAGRETDRVLASVSGITHTDIQTRSPQ